MDLMDLKPKSETIEVLLRHPMTDDALLNDDGSEMSVTVSASYSKDYRAAMHEQQDRRLAIMQKKGPNKPYSAADLETDAIDLLAKVTKEWDITYGGSKPKLTQAKAKEIYSDVFWLRNQIEEALALNVDFTKG